MGVINANRFNFAEVVNKYLVGYSQAATAAMFDAVDEVSLEAVKKLRAESKKTFPNGSGKYAQHWTRKLEKGRIRNYATIYGNAPTYRLSHLLEYGHVSSNGTKRKFGTVPGRVHIEPVAEWAIDEAIDRTIRYMEKANY